ncbi:MAG TPA: ABC transporter ATP-binding protein, partial [Clostridia bacterium]|nr:ABC transporter ATP-binding protein [Clostridia bacterium]
LKVNGISAGYRGVPVISNVSFDIQAQKIYSIIGPNGCGKTTLIRTISRNMRPLSGQILLDGRDIFHTNTKLVARSIAVLSQNNRTMSDVTVKKLVQYGRYAHHDWWMGRSGEDERIVEWAIDKTNLRGYEDRRIHTLSGGEQQRAWLAMSIAQRPRLLLLDEPTTYLDISHQLEIMELISRLNREDGITIVMVLHDINHAARYSDEMIVVKNRGIYMRGDPWTLLENNILRDVFRVEAEITRDAESDRPIFYAKKVVQ